MQRNWFGILVLLAAALAAIYFYPGWREDRGGSGSRQAQNALTKGEMGAKRKEGEGMDPGLVGAGSRPKTVKRAKDNLPAKKAQDILVSSVGGIPVYSRVAHPERFLHLPDGTFVAPLNGVKEPARFLWPDKLPFSPIIGKELDDHGRWWYVHRDGSRSTTYMAYHPQTGKLDPRTDIANPRKPLPLGGEGLPKK